MTGWMKRALTAAALLATLGLEAGIAQAQQADLFNRKMACRQPDTREKRVHIAGGQDADLSRFPFIVQVTVDGARCGGSLIAPGFVLTAAHCVTPVPGRPDCREVERGRCAPVEPQSVSVTRPGPNGRANGEARGVRKVFAHPAFHYGGGRGPALDADVAILVLDREFPIDRSQAVTIADPSLDASFAAGGECGRVAGWGLTDVLDSGNKIVAKGERTEKLQSLNLELVQQDRCAERYPGEITGNMLCAGDGVEGYNTCKGDSGGPLVVDVGVPVQVGVVSWAYGCAQKEHYTVFARVGAPDVRSWINETILGR